MKLGLSNIVLRGGRGKRQRENKCCCWWSKTVCRDCTRGIMDSNSMQWIVTEYCIFGGTQRGRTSSKQKDCDLKHSSIDVTTFSDSHQLTRNLELLLKQCVGSHVK